MPTSETQERKPIPARKTETRRGNNKPAPEDTIFLHGEAISLSSNEGRQFTVDVCRCAESLQTDDSLRRQYDISPQEWSIITEHKGLIKALRAERDRRVRNGQAARELAAKHHATAPNILNEIVTGKSNDRHKIEAIKELRATAMNSDDASTANAGATFVIRIDLSATPGGEVIELKSEKQPLTPIDTGWREVE